MSQYPQYPQYPPPYSPTPPGYGGYAQPSPDQLLAPARRAGILMIVLGVLFVLAGLCLAFVSRMLDHPDFTSQPGYLEMKQQMDQIEAQAGTSVQTVMLIMGAIPLALGALLGGLGFAVRGGGLVPVVLSIALTGLLLLLVGLIVLGGLLQGAVGNPAQLLGVLCFYGSPFLMLVLLMVWLVQAARASSQIAAARQQYQAQVWQYQQQQQNYLQNAGQPQHQQGYGAPPAGMGYHYPPAQPPAGQPPVGQLPVEPLMQQPGPQSSPQQAPPPAPPGGYYVVPPPPADRKDPTDGAPPAG